MLGLAWKTIKARKAGFVGAFVAVLCGAALISACGVLMESGLRAGVPTERFAAADAVITGNRTVRADGGDVLAVQQVTEQPMLPVDLVSVAAATPSVAKAVGEVDFPANVVAAGGTVLTGPGGRDSLGHGWSSAFLAPFTLRAGAAPTGPYDVVLDADLAHRAGVSVGQQVSVETGGVPTRYRVSGIAAPPHGDGLARQSALFFADDVAARLSRHPGLVNAIGVIANPGTDVGSTGFVQWLGSLLGGARTPGLATGLQHALTGHGVTVLTGAQRSEAEFLDVDQTRTRLLVIAGSFGGIAALVAMFVVSSTLALSIQQRRREFALLRAIAATPKQIRKMVGGEALLVSSVAAVVGGALGIAVAQGLRDAFVATGVIPGDFGLAISPVPTVIAVLVAVGTARLAAFVAARRPSRIRPMEALGEAAVERPGLGTVRTAIGSVLLVGGLGVALIPLFLPSSTAATAMSGISALAQVVGLALLGPKVVAAGTSLLAGALRSLSKVGGYLAAANSVTNSRRLAASVTPLMLAIGFTITFFFTQTTLSAAATHQAVAALRADFVVTGRTGGIESTVEASVRSIPGVAAVTPMVRTQAILQYLKPSPRVESVGAIGVDPPGLGLTIAPAVDAGDTGELRGRSVALSKADADFMGAHIGQRIVLYLGDGARADLTLVATYTNALGIGDVILPHDLALDHTTDRLDTLALVRLTPGADRSAVAATLAGLTHRYPGLVVANREDFSASQQSQQQIVFVVNLIALGVILLYIAISVANTLVMTTGERVREFALLQLIGATRRQVIRMMRIEAFVVICIAVVVGSLIPVFPLVFLSLGLSGGVVPFGPPLVYVSIICGAALLAYVSILVPTRVSLRSRPADTVGPLA